MEQWCSPAMSIRRTPPEVVAHAEEDQKEEVMMADLETILVDDARGSAGCHDAFCECGVERGGRDEHLSDQDPVGHRRLQRSRTRHPNCGGPFSANQLGPAPDPRLGYRPDCSALPGCDRP